MKAKPIEIVAVSRFVDYLPTRKQYAIDYIIELPNGALASKVKYFDDVRDTHKFINKAIAGGARAIYSRATPAMQ